ncbi:transposase, partial [Shigella sonnei]|uniref:transposase n=1 Tax=Shigella sonnei TaxID=624 RepID=UPI00092CF1C6
TGGTADRNRSHWSTSKTPSYTKSVSWQHHLIVLSSGGGNDSNLLIVFYVQIMPDDLVMQLHRF